MNDCTVDVMSVSEVLKMNLRIPPYQRPYKWAWRNVSDLLNDISEHVLSGRQSRYRVGTVILHVEDDIFNIVDGQQRLLTFILISIALDARFDCPLMGGAEFGRMISYDKESQRHLHDNYAQINDYIHSLDPLVQKQFAMAMGGALEFVVVCVQRQSEAFQLFDSQNTRGKRLNPHDLLKAYHLRAMNDKYAMEHAVVRWESFESCRIRDLFNSYLYPILNWVTREKCGTFTERDIALFKGVSAYSHYTFVRHVVKAMPCYQLSEQFTEGADFFGLVDHYLNMRDALEREVGSWDGFRGLVTGNGGSTGLCHARRLFYCALMCYFDRFGNFDRRAVLKLCLWAFMIRIDMEHLGFDTINKYATGDDPYGNYTNCYPMFYRIKMARSHQEIADMPILLASEQDCTEMNEERQSVIKTLIGLKGAVGYE